MKRGKFIIIILTLILLISCGLELMEEGENVNDYIYPYLVFTPEENGDGVTVTVVDGAELEEIYIPSTVEVGGVTVPVTSFNGFENPEDAKSVKTITLESAETKVSEKAAEDTQGLVSITVKNVEPDSVWGPLPKVEKDGMEFIGWFISGTSTQVFEGDPITSTSIEPRFRPHTLTKHEGKAPTCTSTGWAEYETCSTCFFTTYTELPKLDHSLTHHEGKEPSCTEDGNLEYWTCSNCSESFSDEKGENIISEVTLPSPGHKTFKVEKKEPTCGKTGTEEHWECERCRSIFEDEAAATETTPDKLTIKALEHDWKRSQFSAECTCTWDECSLCNETTNPTGHSWDSGVLHKEATATESGIMRYTCTNCSITKDEDTAPENDDHIHEWTDVSTVTRTCTTRGYTVRECSVCHISYNYQYIDADGHRTELVEAADPTCTADGCLRHYECSVCHDLFWDRNGINATTEKEIKEGKGKLDHDYSDEYMKDGNSHWHKCRRCEAVRGEKNHSFTEREVSTAHLHRSATCTTAAGYYYSCVCGENGKEFFTYGDPNGHSLEYTKGEAATCTQKGYHEYWTCSVCHKKYFDKAATNEITETNRNEISPTGHTDSGTYTSAGTSGHQKYCSVCKTGYGTLESHSIQNFEWGGSDSEGHWHICTAKGCEYHADYAKHTFKTYGTDKVCEICHYTKTAEQTQGGSFDIKGGTSEPKGTLRITGTAPEYHASFVLDSSSSKTAIEWYLDDVLVARTDECDFETPEYRSYTIMCVIYNGKLAASYSEMVYGGKSH